MNKQQARRIALAVEAAYIQLGAETACNTDSLSKVDAMRFKKAQQEMAWGMLRKAGFDGPMNADDILAAVLG